VSRPGRSYNGGVPDENRWSPALEHIRGGRWLNLAAIGTWLFCGLPPLLGVLSGSGPKVPSVVFVVAFLLYGVALIAILYLPEDHGRHRGPSLPVMLLIVESVTGLALVFISGHYFRGTAATSATLVIVAAQAPYIVSAPMVWLIVAVQTVAMSLMFLDTVSLPAILSIVFALGGFQAFAAGSSFLALKEAAARAALALANAELKAAQARLAESSRGEERLRISRDLHDTLGHHLTALSLQLDVASRLQEGRAADHIRQAHAITRLLLSDVREVVSTLRETRPIDVAREIRALVDAPSSVAIHLEMPSALDLADPERAQALLRCVQEIVTNVARHAQARNLWIRIEPRTGGIALHARDDGQGAAQLSLGHGLTGMRERFAALAGSVEFASNADTGFEVRGFMPTAHPAS
jgi:signal transduction histidine kinase